MQNYIRIENNRRFEVEGEYRMLKKLNKVQYSKLIDIASTHDCGCVYPLSIAEGIQEWEIFAGSEGDYNKILFWVESGFAYLSGNIDEGFCLTLLRLIDAKGMSDVECYKKANVSKQTWHKIMNDKNYRPSKNTVISFAIALELTLSETKDLLGRVGYALSRSSKFDIIIEYFITRGIYDIFEIDETLFKFDQVTLGSWR